jgi:hypothetical protein
LPAGATIGDLQETAMLRVLPAIACFVMLAAAASAQGQVHRCGGTNAYTDKPCPQQMAVDQRPNLMDAGPRAVPAPHEAPPAPALILKNVSRVVDTPEASQSTIFDNQRRRDAEHSSRTGPYTR